MVRAVFGKPMLALLATFAVTTTISAKPVEPANEAGRAWGFDRSDLLPHPGVRFGVLPNGLRYALMRGPTPGLSVRMRVGAGAAVEDADQRGYMHLLEHLVFQGSANLAPGALRMLLWRQGSGGDNAFNAVTGFGETIYSLDLARSDPSARDAALTVMREVASHLSFDRKLVARATRAVQDELATQDAPRERLIAAQDAFFFPDTNVARGPVGGSAASVGRARGAALRRLHARHYLPTNTTLVVVGDIDPALAEREIAARFSDWRAATAGPAAVPGSAVGSAVGSSMPDVQRQRAVRPSPGTPARFFVDSDAQTSVTIAAVEPPAQADGGSRRDDAFLEYLGAEMLGRRLTRIAARAGATVGGGSAAVYDYFEAGRIARIDIAVRDRDWRGALETGAAELARARTVGFTQAELDEQLTLSRAALDRDPRAPTNSGISDAIVDAVSRGLVFTAPADRAGASAYLTGIRLDRVNAAFARAWSGTRPSVFVSHHVPIDGAEAELATLLANILPSAE